jgi:hypothetical protein
MLTPPCDVTTVADPDPGTGAFLSLDPGFGISFFPDSRSNEELSKKFFVKTKTT